MIVVTGKSGVGKTTLLESLEGREVIYMDKWVKDHLYTNGHEVIKMIADEFGQQVIQDDIVNTKELGNIVLHDINELEKLEAIVNPYIHSFLITHKDNKDLIVEMAIYLKNQPLFKDLFDTVILIKRDVITDTKFNYLSKDKSAIDSISDDIEYDYVIDNSNDLDVTKENLIKILEMAYKPGKINSTL